MASIRTGIELNDQFSHVLCGIVSSVNLAISSMEDMNQAMGADVNTSSLQAAREQLNQAAAAADRLNQELQDIGSSTTSQEQLNDRVGELQPRIGQATQGFKGWQKAIIVANNTLGLVKNTLGNFGVMDMGGAFDRIDTMNRFQKTVSIMTGDADMANAALAKLTNTVVGTAYGLDVASKATQGFLTRGMSLGAATEQVRIWADAVSFYGEGTNEQLNSVVDAIGKMYSKGKVEADQLDRLFDAGIGAAEIYAQAVNQSVSKVKDQLSEGDISSAQFIETVSKALDQGVSSGAAKDAGGTWATTFANVKAAITRGWTSTIENLDAALASHGLPSSMEMVTMFGQKVETVLNTIGNHMEWFVGMAVNAGNTMSSTGDFISSNWGTIAPIIGAVVAALGLYTLALGAHNAVQMISNVQKAVAAVQEYRQAKAILATAAAHSAETVATATATVAQTGFNTALLACPLTWIILGLIALIAVIIAVANHFSGAGHTAQSAFGVISGCIFVVGAAFKNFGLSVLNIMLGVYSAIAAFRLNMIAAFYNAICSVQSFWYDLLSTAMTVIESICRALNKLPFIEFDYSGISAAADDYAAKSAEATNNKKEYKSVSDAFKEGSSTFNAFDKGWASNAYANGAKWGDSVTNKVKNMLSPKIKGSETPDKSNGSDYSGALSDTALNTSKTADNTAKTAKALDITSEDLKYLRDIAERDVVNRYTTASINVNMTNHNSINNDMDLDGVTEHLRATIEEQMNAAAEGVH